MRSASPSEASPPLEFIETHLSRVFLTPDEVWKLKKPVYLGFLDFSAPEKRRRACEAEVRLNRALAPEVYRGVVPVTEGPGGRLRIGGAGDPVDWAVHMVRLPDADRADVRLEAGRLSDAHIARIAARLAAFHAQARCDDEIARQGGVAALTRQIRLPIEDPRWPGRGRPSLPEAAKAEAWQLAFLEQNASVFAARVAAGRIRDGHGDLSLAHVFVDDAGAVNVLDRLEFADHFRYTDVCSDVAFLSTDLASRGRVDLAERLVAEYAQAADDFDLYPLLDFYASVRASVRAKTEWFYATREGVDARAHETGIARARRLFLMALSSQRRPLLPPMLVAMGGVVASGKSTLARRVASEIGAPLVSADRTREFLLGARAGGSPHEVRWERAHEPGFTHRVYAEVMRRAGAVLRSGRPVVLDGCFRSPAQRGVARKMATRYGHPFFFVEARVDEGIHAERLRERARRDGVPEDVWFGIAAELRAEWEPAADVPAEEHIVVDSGGTLEESLAALSARLPTWPEGLTG